MRDLILIFCAVVPLFFLMKEKRQRGEKPAMAILCGEIAGTEDSSVSIYIKKWPHGNDDLAMVLSTATKNGKFRFEVPVKRSTIITWTNEAVVLQADFAWESALYLEPGDSLHVFIPGLRPEFTDVQFSGKGAEKEFLLRKIADTYRRILSAKDQRKLTFEEIIVQNLTLRSETKEIINAHKRRINPEAWNEIRQSIMENLITGANFDFLDLSRPEDEVKRDVYRKYRDRLIPEELNADIKEGSRITIFSINDMALVDFLYKNKLPFNRAHSQDYTNMYHLLRETYKDHPAKDFVLSEYILFRAKHLGWTPEIDELAKEYYGEFSVGNKYRIRVARMQQKFTSDSLNLPRLFEFELKDTLNRTVRLDSFRGKPILLDFMFNGCGGCATVTPKLNALERKFQNTDMVFISISIDKSMERFKKGIGKFSSSAAIPLYTNGKGSSHPIIDHLSIIAYPTLVLIDREGKVVSARAPNPGTPEGEKELSDLIGSISGKLGDDDKR